MERCSRPSCLEEMGEWTSVWRQGPEFCFWPPGARGRWWCDGQGRGGPGRWMGLQVPKVCKDLREGLSSLDSVGGYSRTQAVTNTGQCPAQLRRFLCPIPRSGKSVWKIARSSAASTCNTGCSSPAPTAVSWGWSPQPRTPQGTFSSMTRKLCSGRIALNSDTLWWLPTGQPAGRPRPCWSSPWRGHVSARARGGSGRAGCGRAMGIPPRRRGLGLPPSPNGSALEPESPSL